MIKKSGQNRKILQNIIGREMIPKMERNCKKNRYIIISDFRFRLFAALDALGCQAIGLEFLIFLFSNKDLKKIVYSEKLSSLKYFHPN